MKRIIALVLAAIFCLLTFCACGNNESSGDSANVSEIQDSIKKIGTKGMNTYSDILDLYDKYNNLSDKDKDSISNGEELVSTVERLKEVQSFAEKASLIFAKKHREEDELLFDKDLIIDNCWYYYDESADEHFFTYSISSKADDSFHEYYGNGSKDGFGDDKLTDEFVDFQIEAEDHNHIRENGYFGPAYENSKKWLLENGFPDNFDYNERYAYSQNYIELDVEAIQEYHDKNY